MEKVLILKRKTKTEEFEEVLSSTFCDFFLMFWALILVRVFIDSDSGRF
jgi:hypothetical protein